ncbi:MAG: nucleotidyltransferase domain-containing protein [Clostridia bacterium]|nr:nucleotidyltransferase domain-containing protein [Clostridia bacterium]
MIYTVEEIQSIIEPIAKKHGLKAVYLFGSYARGTANEHSDIDLLIDTTGTDLDTFFKLGAVYADFAGALNKEIDLITVSSLEQPPQRPSDAMFRDSVIKERKNVYAVA